MSENSNEARERYGPKAERYLFGGRKWPNTSEAWSEYLDAIHDPHFWPSMSELDAWDARDAWQEARRAWMESQQNAGD